MRDFLDKIRKQSPSHLASYTHLDEIPVLKYWYHGVNQHLDTVVFPQTLQIQSDHLKTPDNTFKTPRSPIQMTVGHWDFFIPYFILIYFLVNVHCQIQFLLSTRKILPVIFSFFFFRLLAELACPFREIKQL